MSLLALVAIAAAWADEPPGALRMRANEMFVPAIAGQVAVTGALDPDHPVTAEAALGFGGVLGRLPGSAWLAVDGSAGFDALALATGATDAAAPVSFGLRLTPWRLDSQSQPIVAAQELRVATVAVGRDRALGTDLAAWVEAIDWSGGMYLPANRRGDLDARVVVGARVLGASWRRPVDGDPAFGLRDGDFVGCSLGGVSGELVYGRRVGPAVTLTAHLGGRADWSIGSTIATTGGAFTAITDTEVWLGGVLDLGPTYSLRLVAGTRTTDANTGPTTYVPTLSLAWRATL